METIKDYSKFCFFTGNREIDKSNVASKIDSIKKIGFKGSILVHKGLYDKTGLYYVIDGQHRFEALKALGMPVPVEFVNGDPDTLIRELNRSNKSWVLTDYIRQGAANGIDGYSALYEMALKYGVWNAIYIYVEDHNPTRLLRAGMPFSVTPYADRMAEFINDIEYPHKRSIRFTSALRKVFKLGTNAHIEILKHRIIGIPKQNSCSAWNAAFENVINLGAKGREKIVLTR